MFGFDERSPTVRHLRDFLEAELDLLPAEVVGKHFRQRRRLRRAGKPLQARSPTAGPDGLEELAVIVSVALEKAGIAATLSGGAAVTIYSHDAYQSVDLDFVTSEGRGQLQAAVASLAPPTPSVMDRLVAYWYHHDRREARRR